MGLVTPSCPDPRLSLFPWPCPPFLPTPPPVGCLPASPFCSINRFCWLQAPHFFGDALRESTVGPVLALGKLRQGGGCEGDSGCWALPGICGGCTPRQHLAPAGLTPMGPRSVGTTLLLGLCGRGWRPSSRPLGLRCPRPCDLGLGHTRNSQGGLVMGHGGGQCAPSLRPEPGPWSATRHAQ